MRFIFFIISATMVFQVAEAQNGPATIAVSEGTFVTVTPSASISVNAANSTTAPDLSSSGENIMDYKSVYEAATLEEEVQMAAQRFNLNKSQQEVWLTAAVDRRQTEKQAYEKLNSKGLEYSKDAVYLGLRMAQNTFYETITGYLNPDQKQALELDRTIRAEKQKRIAKLPPVAPVVIVSPVDSVAIKEAEKLKATEKKSTKKKKKTTSH